MRLDLLPALALPLALAACGGASEDLPADMDLSGVERITIVADRATITLREGAAVSAVTSVGYQPRSQRPELTMEVVDGELVISSTCLESAKLCEVVHTVELPDGVAVDVTLGDGALSADGAIGPLVAQVGVGSVQMVGLTSTIDIVAHDAAITGIDLDSTTVDLWAGAGAVDLSFASQPEAVEIEATDRVDLAIPYGPYDLRLSSMFGDVVIDGIADLDDQAEKVVVVRAVSGDVVVAGR